MRNWIDLALDILPIVVLVSIVIRGDPPDRILLALFVLMPLLYRTSLRIVGRLPDGQQRYGGVVEIVCLTAVLAVVLVGLGLFVAKYVFR